MRSSTFMVYWQVLGFACAAAICVLLEPNSICVAQFPKPPFGGGGGGGGVNPSELLRKLSDAESRLRTAEQNVRNQAGTINSLNGQLRSARDAAAAAQNQFNRVNSQLGAARDAANSAQNQLSEAQRKLAQQADGAQRDAATAASTIQSLRDEVERAKSAASTAQSQLADEVAKARQEAEAGAQNVITALREKLDGAQTQIANAKKQAEQAAADARRAAEQESQRAIQELESQLAMAKTTFQQQLKDQRDSLDREIAQQVKEAAGQIVSRANETLTKRVSEINAQAELKLQAEKKRADDAIRSVEDRIKSDRIDQAKIIVGKANAILKAKLAEGIDAVEKDAKQKIQQAQEAATKSQIEAKDAIAKVHADAERDIKTRVDEAIKGAKSSKGYLDEKAVGKLDDLAHKLPGLNKKVVAYSFSTPGSISMNLKMESVYADLDVGGYIIDTEELQDLIGSGSQAGWDKGAGNKQGEGTWSKFSARFNSPDIILGHHPMLSKRVTNSYGELRSKLFGRHGADHVGFPSERIVTYAGPETGSRLGGAYTIGAYVNDVQRGATDEIVDMVMLEITDAIAWLDVNADPDKLLSAVKSTNTNAKGMADLVFHEIVQPMLTSLTKNPSRFENTYVVAELNPVNFNRDVKPRGAPDWTRNVWTSHHLAISIVLKEPFRRKDPLGYAVKWFNPEFRDSAKGITPDVVRWIAENPASFEKLVQALVEFMGGNGSSTDFDWTKITAKYGGSATGFAINWGFRKVLFKSIKDKLAIDSNFIDDVWKPENATFDVRNPIIDLKGTDRAERLASLLKPFVFGNEGHARIDKLEFNLSNYTVNAQVTLNHRHVFASPNEVMNAVKTNVSSTVDDVIDKIDSSVAKADKLDDSVDGRIAEIPDDPVSQAVMKRNLGAYLDEKFDESKCELVNEPLGGAPLYFVNGIDTKKRGDAKKEQFEAFEDAEALSIRLARAVRLIHNPSANVHDDSVQTMNDRAWHPPVPQPNGTTRALAGMLYHYANKDVPVSLVTHSQGCIIARNAVSTLRALGYDAWVDSQLAWVTVGNPLRREELKPPKRFSLLNNPDDPINQLGSVEKMRGIELEAHSFVKRYVYQLTNELPWESGNGRTAGKPIKDVEVSHIYDKYIFSHEK